MWSGYVMNCKNTNKIKNFARMKFLSPKQWSNYPQNKLSSQEIFENCMLSRITLIRFFKYILLSATETPNFIQFSDVIKFRRAEAKRSILVQVHSSQSFKDLHSYCSTLGNVKKMFHYTTGVEPMVKALTGLEGVF